jgi:hypothetical protein
MAESERRAAQASWLAAALWGRQEAGSAACGAGAEPSAGSSGVLGGQRACASTSARRMPAPSHHGQATVLGEPPRFEITWPLPRQAIHSRGAWDASA